MQKWRFVTKMPMKEYRMPIDNINIVSLTPLITPNQLRQSLPLDDKLAETVISGRTTVQNIILREDAEKILAIVGPCSLHDVDATLEYAKKLKELQEKVGDKVFLVMRAYFEKPRTTIGWKGMLYDPYLDGSYDIEEGLRKARKLLIEITKIGLPIATELLDPIVPQYITDLLSWVAIGARTTESQIHRQMASGLSMPVGFKNSTDGSLYASIQAIKSARNTHSFFGINGDGRVAVAETKGNKCTHFVLRGGVNGPNYASEHIAFAETLMKKIGVSTGIVVDCSHANSNKDYRRQCLALREVIEQKKAGNMSIVGVMLESFLKPGNQKVGDLSRLEYGVSVTDECIGWEETETLISELAESLR